MPSSKPRPTHVKADAKIERLGNERSSASSKRGYTEDFEASSEDCLKKTHTISTLAVYVEYMTNFLGNVSTVCKLPPAPSCVHFVIFCLAPFCPAEPIE